MELRMYGLVNYQLTGIQKGIQFLHGVVEYSQLVQRIGGEELSKYNDWANNHKTVILLNGGTTNNRIEGGEYFGTINRHKETLDRMGILNETFREPDLGDQITSVVFIVDERVFNKVKYPNFEFKKIKNDYMNPIFSNEAEEKRWNKYVKSIGGHRNLWLRYWLENFKLA